MWEPHMFSGMPPSALPAVPTASPAGALLPLWANPSQPAAGTWKQWSEDMHGSCAFMWKSVRQASALWFPR